MSTEITTRPVILNRTQLLEAVPALKPATVAYLLRNRKHNGLAEAGAILKPGKEILFNLEAFTAYLLSLAEKE